MGDYILEYFGFSKRMLGVSSIAHLRSEVSALKVQNVRTQGFCARSRAHTSSLRKQRLLEF